MVPTDIAPWSADWIWSLPLIAVTVMFHCSGLGLLDRQVSRFLNGKRKNRVPQWLSIGVVGAVALCATSLHGFEGTMWAIAYRRLGALPDRKTAVLYSLNAMTTYGHTDLHLAPHWQLMGAIEALNGMILFGLTTAFLFAVMQKLWAHNPST
jgi:hypothetical protein